MLNRAGNLLSTAVQLGLTAADGPCCPLTPLLSSAASTAPHTLPGDGAHARHLGVRNSNRGAAEGCAAESGGRVRARQSVCSCWWDRSGCDASQSAGGHTEVCALPAFSVREACLLPELSAQGAAPARTPLRGPGHGGVFPPLGAVNVPQPLTPARPACHKQPRVRAPEEGMEGSHPSPCTPRRSLTAEPHQRSRWKDPVLSLFRVNTGFVSRVSNAASQSLPGWRER